MSACACAQIEPWKTWNERGMERRVQRGKRDKKKKNRKTDLYTEQATADGPGAPPVLQIWVKIDAENLIGDSVRDIKQPAALCFISQTVCAAWQNWRYLPSGSLKPGPIYTLTLHLLHGPDSYITILLGTSLCAAADAIEKSALIPKC